MKTLYTLILLTLLINGNSQKPVTVELKLNSGNNLISKYSVAQVLDDRSNKDYIGMVKTGLSNKKRPAIFKRTFIDEVHSVFDDLLQSGENSEELTVKIMHFWISEKTTFSNEKGKVEITAEFLKKAEDEYISLGVYSEVLEKGALDVTKKLGKMIPEALANLYNKFIEGESLSRDQELKKLNFEKGYPDDLKIGVYSSYQELLYNRPKIFEQVSIKVKKDDGFVTKYKVTSKNKLIKEFAYYTGEELLLNTYSISNEASSFISPRTTGRYLVYPYRSPDSGATAAFGAIGALASNKKRLLLFDTETGLLQDINNQLLSKISSEYEDVSNTIGVEEMDLESIISLIQELNERVKDSK